VSDLPVTVIIPTFRDGEALARALSSIAGQTRPPAEVIVIDDAGEDPALEAVVARAGLANLRILRLSRNIGPGGARNAGIAAARQPFLAFLDADDEWRREKLERQMALMLAPDAPVFSAHLKAFNGARWPDEQAAGAAEPIGRWRLLLSNPASISTVVVRRDAVCRLFPEWHAAEDYFFVAANLLTGLSNLKLNQILARADKPAFGAGGLSGRLLAMQLGEMRAHFHLWRTDAISLPEYLLLVPWTLLKLVRRLTLVTLRRLWPEHRTPV
jgi:glycosyltransferase involved in cell wall biosynthesis